MSSKRKAEPNIRVQLPITPFLDMSFQLMFFFVLTFRPQAQEGQIGMYLPKAPGNAASLDVPPPFDPDEEKKEYTIEVRSGNGAINSLAFVDDAGRTELGGGVEALAAKLKSIPLIKDAKKPNIKIEAMEDLQYAQLMMLMDTCIRNGFDKVGVAKLAPKAPPMGG